VIAAQQRADAEVASRREAAEEEIRALEADAAAAADNRRQVFEDLRRMVARLEAAIGETDGD